MPRFMRALRVLTIVLAMLIPAVPAAQAAAEPDKDSIIFIGQQPGTSGYSFIAVLSRFLQEAMPAAKITVVPRGGTMSNPTSLDQGKGTLAYASSTTAEWAWKGMPGVYDAYGTHKNIRAVSVGQMNNIYGFVAVRKEFVDKTGADSLEKLLTLKDKPRVGIRPPGVIAVPAFIEFFKLMGVSMEDFRKEGKLVQTQIPQMSEMLRDNRMDVCLEFVPLQHPGFTELALTNNLVFMPLPDKVLKAGAALGMTPTTMPAGSYKGMDQPYKTFSTSAAFLAHKDAPDNVVYQLAKSMVERRKELIAECPSVSDWEPEKDHSRAGLSLPLHPGAEKYYREIGWIK